MVSWGEIEQAEPDLARRVRERLDAHKHKTLATLRRDGSPRISGIEVTFAGGELWFGSMPGAVKEADLRRDPRMALHSGSEDADPEHPDGWPGDAKLAGRAVELTGDAERAAFWAAQEHQPPPGTESSPIFRVDVTEVVLTRVEKDELVIESWHEKAGHRIRRRT